MSKIDEFIERDVEHAKKMFEETGEVMPLFTLHTESGFIPFVCPFTDGEEKRGMLRLIQTYMIKYKAYAYSVVHEGWMKQFDTAEEMEKNGQKIKDQPGAIECLIVIYVSHDRKQMTTFKVKRDGDRVELIDRASTEDAGGIFTELLPPAHVTNQEYTEEQKASLEAIISLICLHYGMMPVEIPLKGQEEKPEGQRADQEK